MNFFVIDPISYRVIKEQLTATRIQKNVTDKYGPGSSASMFSAIIPPKTAEIPTMTSIT